MPLEPFLVNPPRRLLAYGLNPRRKKKNPPVRVHFPSHDETLFRVSKTGRWGRKKRKKLSPGGTSARAKRRASPAHKGAEPMRKTRKVRRVKRVKARRAVSKRRHSVRRRRNPIILGANPPRRMIRRRSYRRNPLSLSGWGLPSLKYVGAVTAGAVASSLVTARLLGFLPAAFTTNPIPRAASRLAVGVFGGMAIKKFLKSDTAATAWLAVQMPKVADDLLSLAGVKLSDGEAELALYTLSGGESGGELPAPSSEGMNLYTLSEPEGVTIG